MIDILKVDFEKTGLEIFVKEYQADMIKFVLNYPEQKSRDVNKYINSNVIGAKRSRASVINSLNMLVEWGLLEYYEDTGKGGHHRIYSINKKLNIEDEDDIVRWFLKCINDKVIDSLGGNI